MKLPSVRSAVFGVAFGLAAIWLYNNVDVVKDAVG